MEKLRLAIVEDDNAMLQKIANVLKTEADIINYPIDVECVNTPEKAYSFLMANKPDVVILDYFLKGGKTTLELVRKCHNYGFKPLFVVHSTEWSHEGTRKKFKALGVTQGVTKLDFESMKAIIRVYKENPPEKEEPPCRFHELPYDIRSEEFYDHLMALSVIDLRLQTHLIKKPNKNLAKIEQDLVSAIIKLRDFVLYIKK